MATSETNIAETPIHLETSEILLQKLLVAIDFTKQSPRVLQGSRHDRPCFGSEILLVHAASPLIYGTGMEPVPTAPFEMELEAAKAQMADLIAKRTGASKNFTPSRICRVRDFQSAWFVVSRRKTQVDLVLAGSHGASGLERLALGSVAESILDALPCPVLIIGPNCHKNSSHSGLFCLRPISRPPAFAEHSSLHRLPRGSMPSSHFSMSLRRSRVALACNLNLKKTRSGMS